METALLIITFTVAFVFVVTAIFTLLGIVHIGGRKIIEFDDTKYRDRLFNVLVVEIVVLCVSVAAYALNRTAKANEQVREAQKELVLSEQAWAEASLGWMSEPSGIAPSNLKDQHDEGRPLAVGVDDDEPGVFVLQSIKPDNALVVRRVIPLEDKDHKPIMLSDAEAITYDGARYYYLITSHRRLDKANVNYLLRFEINPKLWEQPDYKITVDTVYDLNPESKDSNHSLLGFLKEKQIPVDEELWQGRKDTKDKTHEFAVEIEGVAYVQNRLLLGLKWPLVDDNGTKKAIVLSYNITSNTFESYYTLDLDGKGVSDLFYSSDRQILHVAANPPEKPRDPPDENATKDREKFYGHSEIYRYRLDQAGAPKEKLPPIPNISFLYGKLEGIARIGEELWLVYDGDKPKFTRYVSSD